MPKYVRSLYHPIFLNPEGGASISRTTVQVSQEEIASNSFEQEVSKRLLINLISFGNAFHDFTSEENSFQTPEENVYAPFSYKSGVTILDINQLTGNDNFSYINSTIDPFTIPRIVFRDFIAEGQELVSISDCSAVDVVIVNKFYYRFGSDFYASEGMEEDITLLKDNVFYINFSMGKVIKIYSEANSETSVSSFIFKSRKTYEYEEDFGEVLFYNGSICYLDEAFTKEANLTVLKEFFPYVLISQGNGRVKGKSSTTFKLITDVDLDNVGIDLNNDTIPDVDSENPTANPDEITCSATLVGNVQISYLGQLITEKNLQVCGSTPATMFGIIKRENSQILSLYSNFLSLTSETATAYLFNARYVDYIYVLSNVDTYVNFIDNSSVATSTTKYTNQALDFNYYYSIKDSSDGSITAITFKFLIYSVNTSDSHASTYLLDIPVSIKVPTINSINIDTENSKIIVNTSYANTISYYFGNDDTNPSSLAISFDGDNGASQTTEIDFSSAKSDEIKIIAYGYYYDFGGETRPIYKSKTFSTKVPITYQLTNLKLEIKTGSPESAITFYDENDTALTYLGNPALYLAPCYQATSFSQYNLYLDYASDYDISFVFTFTIPSGFNSLYLQIGNSNIRTKLTSANSVKIKKSELFSILNSAGKINLTLWLNNEIPFVLPFTIKNYTSSSPAIASVSTPLVVFSTSSRVEISSSVSYTYADSVEYSVLDQNSSILLGPIKLGKSSYADLLSKFTSGSSFSKSIDSKTFSLKGATSISINVKASVIKGTGSPISFSQEIVSLDSTAFSMPKKLNEKTPAKIKFYSDQAMGPGTEVSFISKGVTYYAFLQLIDFDGSDVLVGDYADYISTNPAPKFTPIDIIESDQDVNNDLIGVSVIRINDYLYSFNISAQSGFDDSSFVLGVTYSPILDN